ncbi:2,3-diaminopropionate biosynthesis protein SbnB [Amycolatopsis minnesotensis]|uniref:2,3-diaminopropionate biosynthesis protein SbnB n=1 Tax=Amycolatopsis minnesotensis TaxID=337894 RepID=A0ABN2PYY1_9PSEU
MPERNGIPPFSVISGRQVFGVLDGNEKKVVDIVESAYRLHGEGDTVNPPSYFLRFPDRPASRIIALPASVGGDNSVDGVKWISSFPGNVANGVPRASAVLILNDHDTGYPIACLESSVISAARTAASAALAAAALTRGHDRPRRVGFLGTGLIARYLHTYLARTGWEFDEIGVHDLNAESADGFRDYLDGAGTTGTITVHPDAESLIRGSDLVVLATVAGTPHIHDVDWFRHDPLVLNVSLRDLAPEIILISTNIVDDVDHCLKADTSPHLAEQLTGDRGFLSGTLFDVLEGRVDLPRDRPLVFSPFGLGVLDLAVAKHVYDELGESGALSVVPDFFHETDRHRKADK